MPSLLDLTTADASVDDQLRALEDLLRTLDPAPQAPVAAPRPVAGPDRLADLRRAKALIDQAIDLVAPHFPSQG